MLSFTDPRSALWAGRAFRRRPSRPIEGVPFPPAVTPTPPAPPVTVWVLVRRVDDRFGQHVMGVYPSADAAKRDADRRAGHPLEWLEDPDFGCSWSRHDGHGGTWGVERHRVHP